MSIEELKKSGRGGRRAGAGRKKSNDGRGTDRKKHAVYCDVYEIAVLRVLLQELRNENRDCTIRDAAKIAAETADERIKRHSEGKRRYLKGIDGVD